MRLVMVTRKVDRAEHLAGFIYRWVEELARHVDRLEVLTWQAGDASGLPANVTVHQPPAGGSRLARIGWLFRQTWWLAPAADGFFCHMNPEYTIVAGTAARLRGKRVVSWYTHRHVGWRLRLMERIANRILTATAESFRLPSRKVVTVGHGIDTEYFEPGGNASRRPAQLISVGRISPTKDLESMIKAVAELRRSGPSVSLSIVGAPGLPGHQVYLASLQAMAQRMELADAVQFIGPVPNRELRPHLQAANIFLNLSGTGSLDKAVLEAMACGCLVLTSNEAFRSILPPELMVSANDFRQLAERIKWTLALPAVERQRYAEQLRRTVVEHHNLASLMVKVVSQFQ